MRANENISNYPRACIKHKYYYPNALSLYLTLSLTHTAKGTYSAHIMQVCLFSVSHNSRIWHRNGRTIKE